MKHIFKYCLAVSLLVTAMLVNHSCNKVDASDEYGDFLQPDRIGLLNTSVNLNVQGEGAQNIIAITGPHSGWTVTSSESWLTVEKGTTSENGKEEPVVKLSAATNTGYSRKATVTIKLEGTEKEVTKTFTVTQASALPEPAVSLPATTLNFTATAENKTVTLTTNQTEWTATSDATWFTISKNGKDLIIAVTANTGNAPREAVVNIVAGVAPNTAKATLRVVQAKADDINNITVSGIELVRVEAGTFKMGAQNTDATAANYGVIATGSGYAANQGPIHNVTLSEFYIGKYLITQAQWVDVMGTNPSKNIGNNNPVEYVNWTMAADFVAKLSLKTGKTFRLPTEAEWEYAARGGKNSNGYVFSGGNASAVVANFVANTADRDNSRTTPGGTFLPNELGIYDMSGNLYQWCSDYFAAYTADDQVNPTGPATGTNKVMRGGSWWHLQTTVYYRGNNTVTYTGTHANAGLTGLRVVYVP
ncbi:SUMF1/EgtB/PvdO family nonheme iron enzyme [Pseudobacter ginsenosidimutans]|uniref:Formylglycine-generating enzyme required for sulfatase activity n=1 Tax=Pseudobacter ginsenosidimutans TaxID=661488 RepID=A0A4Q7MAV5_9BACT|nr:SUMF1/EgtB/PvdO family nonheme iron enzyme [Pseudobacter ginsenosidimutans]QEC42564.1 SUMF1/EgtB/PvdOfamily nonheme iron enzyme [Pseudobacter ginsenosidimutans]RZS63948.1 formylglycine-generating enzyme required for sulfatase activity [Pseudobacter ginsenosidimutans]